jgi:hypothetical protein
LNIKTDIAELKFDGQQTLEIIMLENIELTILNVKQTFEKTKSLTSGKKVKVLLDLRGLQFSYIPSEVMDYMAKSAFNKYQEAVAILIEGLGQKLLGNFYMKIVKPDVQTKVFTCNNEALKWLKSINETQNA